MKKYGKSFINFSNESIKKLKHSLNIRKTIQKLISITNLISIIIAIFSIFLLLYQLRIVDKKAFLVVNFKYVFLYLIIFYIAIVAWQIKKTDTGRFTQYALQSVFLIGLYFYSELAFSSVFSRHIFIAVGIIVYLWIIVSNWSSLLYSALSPSQSITFSFMFVIIMGALMLYLPASTVAGRVKLVDAFFMATSAVCVTGLTVFDLSKDFTLFGKTVMICLIQIGGIGIMTFSVLFIQILGARMSVNDRIRRFGLFDINTKYKPKHIVYTIIITTFIIEMIGACILYSQIKIENVPERIYTAVFHSISAFCNAGFSILPNGLYSVIDNYAFVITVGILIILGGIGFIVMFHAFIFILRYIANFIKFPFFKLRNTIQTRIVITTSLLLIVFGMAFIFFNESDNALKTFPLGKKLVVSFFHSVSPRTAGFEVMPISLYKDVTKLCIMFLMFIGASSGSTGGGIKTTTFFVLIYSLILVVKNKSYIAIRGRRIPEYLIHKAVAVTTISLIVCISSTYAIYLIQPNLPLLSIAYECISALSTVGLSLGITDSLSTLSKCIVILLMYIGRIGYLTILMSIGKGSVSGSTNIVDVPSENIMIG